MTLEDLTNIHAGDGPLDLSIDAPRDNQRQPRYDIAPYNPFMQKPLSSWDAQCMDRMLTIKRPKSLSGQIWITDSGFAEVLELLPLNKPDQQKFWRKFRKIQMLATGELNRKIVDSRQERLLIELVSQKSRLDVAANGNLNEREQWVTNRQVIEQTLKTPQMVQRKGFFQSVADGLAGR